MVGWCLTAQPSGFLSLISKGKAVYFSQNTRLYSDSSYSKPTELILTEGSIAELIQQTEQHYPDNAQKQLFKWYKIRQDSKEGWVYGDEALLSMPFFKLTEVLKPFHLKKINLGRGFENALCWFASLEGSDIRKNLRQNAEYQETYMIISPPFGKSLFIPIGIKSSENSTQVTKLFIRDVTEDEVEDILLETQHQEGSSVGKEASIHSIQSGIFKKIWEENLAISNDDKDIPHIYKQILIQKGTIRTSYLNLKNCTTSECSSLKTSTLRWNSQMKTFEIFYPESSVPIKSSLSAISLCCIKKLGGEWMVQAKENASTVSLKQVSWNSSFVQKYFQYLLSGSLESLGGIEP